MKKFYLLIFSCCCFLGGSFAQTLIDPVTGGGFDAGNTFALNGWTVVNSSANKWVVGSTTFNSAPNSAYISHDGNVANYDYDNTTAHISHFYQKVTIPPNATNVTLSFQLKGSLQDDASFNLLDGLEIFADPSLTVPVADALPGGAAIQEFFQFNQNVTYVGQTINVNSLSGKTVLLIFSWVNNGDGVGSNPPASVDDISLTYCIKPTYYTVTGGGGFCTGTAGAHVGLPGSTIGISYQLYNNGNPVGSPIAGTGGPIDFGPQNVVGNYTVVGTSGACVYDMNGSVNVTENPLPVATAGNNSPLCAGSSLNLTSGGGTTYSWTGPNSFASLTQNPSIANVTTAASGLYTVTVTDANGCSAPASTSVTITPSNTATLTSAAGTDAQTVCVNTPVTNIKYTTTGATGATFSGLPAGVTGSWLANVVTIGGTPTATGTFNYTITLTGGCPVPVNGSVTVIAGNTITLSSAAGTDAQSVCINTPITNITYSTAGATGATFSGLPAGVSGSWASNIVTISGTPTTSVGSPFTYTITLSGGCGSVTKNGSIAVNPNNTIILSSAAGTDAQSTCVNSAITNITYATTGATGATFSGLPPGVTGSWASNVVTISGSPTTTVGSPFNYTITLTGGCGTVTKGGSITVTTSNSIVLSSGVGTDAQTECINIPITNITYITTGASGATFSGLPAGVTGNWASNMATISGTPTTAAGSPFNFTITLTGGCGLVTKTGSLTVNPNNSIILSSAAGTDAQSVCINTPVTSITYATTGATGATFSGLPAGLTGNWASNVVTISGTPTTTTGSPFNYTVTLTGGCGNITKSGSITVNPNNTILLSSAAGTNAQTICINTPVTNITYATTGATGATFSGLPAGVTGSWAANVVTISGTPVTAAGSPFSYIVTLTGGCGNITATGSIAVTPNNSIVLSSAAGTDAQSICINTAITNITYTTTRATGATFSGLPAGVTGNWVANVVTISGTPSTATGSPFNYTVTLTGGCGNIQATGTITVSALASLVLTSPAGSDAQTICNGSAIASIVYALNNATGAFGTGLPAGVTVSPGIGTLTLSGTPTQTGTFTYTITSTGGCGTANATGTITVQPAVGGTVTSISICSGGSGSLTLSGQAGSIVRWEYSTDGGTTWNPSSVIPNTTTTQTFTNVIVPTLYRAVVSNGCGNVNSATGLVSIHNLWTGTVSSDWNTAGNWSDGQVPTTSCSEVYIPGGTPFEPILSGAPTATITNLHILSGAGVTVNGSGTMQIGGTISNLGTFDVTGGTLELNGASGTQNIAGDIFYKNTIKNLTISNNVNVANTANDTLNILGTLAFGNAAAGLNTGDNITLKSSALATANVGILAAGNTITGNVTVERYIATGTTGAPNHGKSWQLLAIPAFGSQTIKAAWQEGATATNISTAGAVGPGNPVAGYGTMITSAVAGAATQPTPGFDAYTSPGPSMKIYDTLSTNYFGTASTQVPIYDQRGYFVFVRGDRSVYTSAGAATPTVLRTKGKLFTPANPPPVSTVIGFAGGGDFATIGNPYASAIDVRNITLSGGTQKFFTVWDPRLGGAYNYGAFQTLSYDNVAGHFYATPGGGSYGAGPVDYIQSGQAFFMQAFGSNGTVSFTESCKANGSALFTTPNPVSQVQQILRTSLNTINADGTTGNLLDGVLSSFDDTYNNIVDGMDARKAANTGENLGIKTGGKLLSIERRQPVTPTDTIFFNITGERNQPYRFHFDAGNLDPSVQGYVVDNFTNTRTPLNMTGTTDVDFTVSTVAGSNAANRFMIVFEPLKALPVTFTSIKAWIQDKNIDVQWRVDNEVNMKQYEVEKSTDGSRFTTIAQQQPTANNGRSAVYVVADANPVAGFNYYRVKSLDINGQMSYTNVVEVTMGSIKQDITIYPNPITDGMIHLQFLNEPAGKYSIRLLNKLGQVILQKQVTRADGNGTELIKWDYNLARGMYQLEITRPDGSVKDINVMY